MNEYKIFRRLLETYAKLTKREVVIVIRPTGVIQFAGENINIRIEDVPHEKWIQVMGEEIYQNLIKRMKTLVPTPEEIDLDGDDQMADDPDLM